MGLIEQCVEWGRTHPRTVVFPESMDERALTGVQILAKQGSLKPVLLGDPQSLQSLTQTNINDMGALRIVDPFSAPELAVYSQRLLEKCVARPAFRLWNTPGGNCRIPYGLAP